MPDSECCISYRRDRAVSVVCSDKGKTIEPVTQNPSVHGHSAGNPLARMSMGKPTEDQLDRASVVKMPR